MYSTVYLWVRAVVVFGLPAAVAAIAGVLLIRGDRVIIGGALFAARVAGLALTYPLTPTARAVLTVVLYRYAESGTGYGASPPSCSSTVCAAPRASSAAWPSGSRAIASGGCAAECSATSTSRPQTRTREPSCAKGSWRCASSHLRVAMSERLRRPSADARLGRAPSAPDHSPLTPAPPGGSSCLRGSLRALGARPETNCATWARCKTGATGFHSDHILCRCNGVSSQDMRHIFATLG